MTKRISRIADSFVPPAVRVAAIASVRVEGLDQAILAKSSYKSEAHLRLKQTWSSRVYSLRRPIHTPDQQHHDVYRPVVLHQDSLRIFEGERGGFKGTESHGRNISHTCFNCFIGQRNSPGTLRVEARCCAQTIQLKSGSGPFALIEPRVSMV
ncbi:hypothetical protein TWF173_003704 [Orbilia oligospora]|nr:hypothetical protein TWF173_003704 [Orbilia oligospora]